MLVPEAPLQEKPLVDAHGVVDKRVEQESSQSTRGGRGPSHSQGVRNFLAVRGLARDLRTAYNSTDKSLAKAGEDKEDKMGW